MELSSILDFINILKSLIELKEKIKVNSNSKTSDETKEKLVDSEVSMILKKIISDLNLSEEDLEDFESEIEKLEKSYKETKKTKNVKNIVRKTKESFRMAKKAGTKKKAAKKKEVARSEKRSAKKTAKHRNVSRKKSARKKKK